MKAMVLAAGVGERMRPLTDHCPKPLLPIANRPLMGYILEHLSRHGFTEVVANLHHKAEDIAESFGDGLDYGVQLHYDYEQQLWGSAGSVRRNEAFLSGEAFLVTGADDLTDMDLRVLIAGHERTGATASLGLVEVEDTSQFGIVVTGEDGCIQRFVEKPKSDPPSNTANTQIYLFSPAILDLIPPGEWYDFGFGVFPELVATGRPFYGFRLPGSWRDVGSVESYLAAHRDVLEGRIKTSLLAQQKAPGVWIGEGCEVHPRARLEPPYLLGDGCCIEAGARVGGATALAEGVRVPAHTSLWNCVVWKDGVIPSGVSLERAVVCREGVLALLD